MTTLDPQETKAILTLCLIASFTDGEKHDRERRQIRQITASLSGDGEDLTELYQEVILNKPSVVHVVQQLTSPESRQLAYEMAVGVCEADDVRNEAERKFLDELRTALALPSSAADATDAESTTLVTTPVAADDVPAPPAGDSADMILRYAVVGGALELLPQTMATLAIVPLQAKMVYRIGRQRGYELDRKSIAEFMATVGLGLASQVFEGYARRLTRGLGKKLGGKLGGKIGDAAGGIAMSFATTYALGHLAQLYYDSGRQLGLDALRAKYTPLLDEGKQLAQQHLPQIMDRSRQLQGVDLATLMKGAV